MSIKAMGEFWNPDIVTWGQRGPGNHGRLLGTAKPNRKADFEVDLWDATGVYVLYSAFQAVYVGQADKRLGPRLRDHLGDRLAGRWDMFSWYCLDSLNSTTNNTRYPGTRRLTPTFVMDTVEAVLIQALQPPLNRRYNEIPEVVRVVQRSAGQRLSDRGYLERILKTVEARGEPEPEPEPEP